MNPTTSYFPDYFSIDDIMATQEKINCKLITDIPRLGFLCPTTKSNDLKAGWTTELPYWLAESIGLGRGKLVRGELPRAYSANVREILKADASVVDIHKLGNHFYDFGVYASKFDSNPNDIIVVLIATFKNRFRDLLTLTQNPRINTAMTNKLDTFEKRLFQAAHRSAMLLYEWFITNGTVIEAADMVANHKKRKLAATEYI